MTRVFASARASRGDVVIGLELHVRLQTVTKLFCGCRVEFGSAPNRRVCPVCLGLPGALPVVNGRAVELAVRAAVALGCAVHRRSSFVRKHYFYPDLPKGYQITQYAHPLATGGEVVVGAGAAQRRVRIRRLHLEEDAGKSLHDRFPGATAVDFNRAGAPLVEIVTEPDLRSPAEARAFLIRTKQVLEHYAEVSDCNMEEGSLRVDANLSIQPGQRETREAKTEIKNLNSFAFVEKALAHERDRQIEILSSGGKVARETRLFDPERGETRRLRRKEAKMDYRYFPDPDLPYLEIEAERLEAERRSVGELPHDLERRLETQYRLSSQTAVWLAKTPRRAQYFEAASDRRGGEMAHLTANLMMRDLAAELNREPRAKTEWDLLPPDLLHRVAELRLEGALSSATASELLVHLMAGEGTDVDALVESRDLVQVRDVQRLTVWVDTVLASNPVEAARYANGEARLLGFLLGEAMRLSRGRADPRRLRELLRLRLEDMRR